MGNNKSARSIEFLYPENWPTGTRNSCVIPRMWSTDGSVEDNSVVEGKCPYTQRNLTIEEAIATNNFCLEKKDGKISLKQKHLRWHQVQGQMFFLLNGQSVTLLYEQQRTLLYWKFSAMTLGR